jgi:hypothetical protein
MSALLLYLLQVNLLLLGFAAGWPLLRRLTFLTLNRAYLLLALLTAAAGPLLPAVPTGWTASAELGPALAGQWLVGSAGMPAASTSAEPTWSLVLLALYALGAAGLLGRLLLQGWGLRRLHLASRPATHQGLAYRHVALALGPCSFWRTIYLNPLGLTPTELTAVLRHEQAHVQQWHTLDVLLSQLLSCLAWLNPAAWALRRAVRTNLEFLADRHALRDGALDRRAYQLSLVRLAQAGTTGPSLLLPFLFPPLKARILMLNTPASAPHQVARYLLLAPLLALLLGLNAACSDRTPLLLKTVYYVDGQRVPEAVAVPLLATPQRLSSKEELWGDAVRQFGVSTEQVVLLTTKAGQHVGTPQAVAAQAARLRATAPTVQVQSVAQDSPLHKQRLSLSAAPLPAAALAYLSKTYPGYRLIQTVQFLSDAGQVEQFRLQVARGPQTKHVLFDAGGQFVREQ